MSTFSKGDKVRCIKTWTTHFIDADEEYVVEDVRPDNLTDTMEALVRGEWVPFSYFEKAEPESAVFKPGDPVWIYPAELDGKPAWAIQPQTKVIEPEDKDDLYVEPEPLKEDQRAFNDDDVQRLKVTNGSTVLFDGLAVFEEADDGKVTVTPVPRCTSLFNRAGTSEIVRCGQHEGHGHGHWTIGSHPATSWGDSMEYGRMVESGGAS